MDSPVRPARLLAKQNEDLSEQSEQKQYLRHLQTIL